MNEPSYQFNKIEERLLIEFESKSEEKIIKKLIEFWLIDSEASLYNLALLDVLSDNTISDLNVSNNKDMPKVLATVFQSILYFFEKKPKAKISFQGNSAARNRLYQMAISKYLTQIEQKLEIFGFISNAIEKFETGKNYDRFLILLKY